ncbi:MAG: 2,3,4,5-tetrahydropyridine-2,6-dicarboxylate N-succinyltransferase, partial [Myxococcales bacterium]|nr:2,3,4,5-tetrahydropyridine-2,6-dicarboxylate N-succinyltransferase [Myxococcales bacterium]
MEPRRALIEAAFADRNQLAAAAEAVRSVIADLDCGALRVAEPDGEGGWTVHAWVKQAVLLYFGICEMQTLEVGPFEYHDKIPTKT